MRIAVLVKQVPRFEEMQLMPDGRLRREGVELELNPYCRRAVSKGAELARLTGGSATVITLGPPAAEDCLREAIAWGATTGVLVSDIAFAGSDTLATARALAATLRELGGFDLVLTGRNSVDADTGQVGPSLAEMLDLPFASAARELELVEGGLRLRCEVEDGFATVELPLPAVVACAERLCEPAKVDPEQRALVDPGLIRHVSAADLGEGPWGQSGSPTSVGRVRVLATPRLRRRFEGDVAAQVAQAVGLLREQGALVAGAAAVAGSLPAAVPLRGPAVAALAEPDLECPTRELCAAAAHLAAAIGGHAVLLSAAEVDASDAAAMGADRLVLLDAAPAADAAAEVAAWAEENAPWAILAPGTSWGREVAARAAARLQAGLVGDAVELDVEDGRLVAWKPAFGGQLVAAITASSPVQMATVRPGVVPAPRPRPVKPIPVERRTPVARDRVLVRERVRDDDVETLALADAVLTVGASIKPEDYPALEPLRHALGAELACTRKVTDRGWLPRSRQVGITGRSISPRLVLTVGVSGKFNHIVGMRGAGTVVAINRDPEAPIFACADIGIVGDWREAVEALVVELSARAGDSPS
jgi:electron transfer flavoprotein alpha subunit